MPPKAKDKNVTPAEPRVGEEVRVITIQVEGLINSKLEDPYLSVQLPKEDEPRESDLLYKSKCFDGSYADAAGNKIIIETSLKDNTITALCAKTKSVLWKADSLPEIGGNESTAGIEGKYKIEIDKNRTHWIDCTIQAQSTCEILVTTSKEDVFTYFREGQHAFCFSTTLLTLEINPVNTEAIKGILSTQLSLKVLAKKVIPQEQREQSEGLSKPKKGGKDDKPKNPTASGEEKIYSVHVQTPFSFVPLVMGAVKSEILCEDVSTAKARHPLDGFTKFKIIMRVFGEDGLPKKLLTPRQEQTLMPMSLSIQSVQEVPDTRPVSISKTEAGRPNVDFIATARPDYSSQKTTSTGVRVVCQILPGAPELSTLPVPHERNVGIFQHQLILLSEIDTVTGGAIPNTLHLVKHLFESEVVVKVFDREISKSDSGEEGQQSGFGVAKFNLSQLLKEESAQPTLKICEQVRTYRPSISEYDSSSSASQLPTGHYMSWGTTVTMKLSLSTKIPKLSFSQNCLHRHCASIAAAASVSLLTVISLLFDEGIDVLETNDNSPPIDSLAMTTNTTTDVPLYQIEIPIFSRLIIIVDYKRDSNHHIVHSIMSSVIKTERTADDHSGDILPFESHIVEDKIENEAPQDPKKKGGKQPPPPQQQQQQSDPVDEEGVLGENGIIEVQTSDTISGFEVIDGVIRIIVIEGLTTTILSSVISAIHDTTTGEDVLTDAVRLIYNPTISFPKRSYHTWPPLVEHVENNTSEEEASTDAGGVGNRIRRIRLSKSLSELNGTFCNYVKRSVSEGVLRCINTLSMLLTLTNMSDAIAFGSFPAAADLIQLERMYGITLSAYDVCGSETFCPFGTQIDSCGVTIESQNNNATTEVADQTLDRRDTVDLWQHLGNDIIVVGKPVPCDVLFGRRATNKSIELPEPYTAMKQQMLYVPATNDYIVMILSGVPILQKSIPHQIEGKLIGIQQEGLLGIVVYRWKEHVEGRLGGSTRNINFITQKTTDRIKLPYTHYTKIESQKQRHRRLEQSKKNETTRKEEANDSSGSDIDDYDYSMGLRKTDELDVPPHFAKVQRSYRHHNKYVLQSMNPLSKRRHKPHSGYDDTTTVINKPEQDTRSKTAFKQLIGGWTPLLEEHLQTDLFVKIDSSNNTPLKGVIVSWEGTLITVQLEADGGQRKVRISNLKVDAKCSRLDNKHPLRPAACRVEDLKQPWHPQKNPFERCVGGEKDMVITKPRDLIGGKVKSVFALDGADGQEKKERDRLAAERELWKSKVVVSDPVFRICKPTYHAIDKTKSLLVGGPQKRAFVKNAPETPPLTIHKPNTDIQKGDYEVSTVYYAGNSHKWDALDNIVRKPIKPVSDAEKKGPIW